MRLQLEQRLQRQIAEYLSWALIQPVIWTSHPAGGGGELRGKILKGMGLRAGWPDLEIIHDGKFYGIELKAPHGVLSEAQRSTLAAIEAAGGHIAVCHSFDAVRGALWAWGVPLRERKPTPQIISSLAADLATAGSLAQSPPGTGQAEATGVPSPLVSRIETIVSRARSTSTRRSMRSRSKET